MKTLNIALLSSYTCQPLSKPIVQAAATAGFEASITVGAYQQFVQELLDPNSFLSESAYDSVGIMLSTNSFFPHLLYEYSVQGFERTLHTCLQKTQQLIDALKSTPHNTQFIVTALDVPNTNHISIHDHLKEDSVQKIVQKCNALLKQYIATAHNSTLLDTTGLDHSIKDPKMYYLGKIEHNADQSRSLAQLFVNAMCATLNVKRKVIVVDLDNTLWGGVIGEDGVENLHISQGTKGEIYADIQRQIKIMQTKGLIIALCSKNNEEDALEVFEKRTDMLIKLDDVVTHRINWEPKSVNLQSIAQELNVGIDSLIFLDDNPAERLEVSAALPEVYVVDFPKDIANLPFVLEQLSLVTSVDTTDEDKVKTEQYQQEKKRTNLQNKHSLNDYLQQLNIKVNVRINDSTQAQRITQLINKTNQFNLTTKRYTAQQVAEFLADPNVLVATVQASDTFGDLGVVGVLIIKNQNIDTFLLSCRAMSRGIEQAFLREVLSGFKGELTAEYIKTAKNSPVVDLYDKLGFELVNGETENKSYILREITQLKADTDWIAIDNGN